MNFSRLLFRLLLGRRLPVTQGDLSVPGIQRPVLIRRDGYGIPHIEAEGDDAWYGLGFCQGQDRAFQLETMLRAARGTLAELAGAEVLSVDRIARRVGFLRAAKQQVGVLADDIRRMLEAFAAGVRSGTRIGCRPVAHEFALLRGEPTEYTAADVVAIIKLQSFVLASNWDVELARLKVLALDGPEALVSLDPVYPEWLPVSSPVGVAAAGAVDRLAQDLSVLRETVGLSGASNNWAIAPFRTATGRPIVANDPHFPPMLPPPWYLAHVRTPDWAVAGAAFVGGPGLSAGHNGTAAWGMTAGLVDNTDLYLEETGPDGRSVREGEEYVPCEVRREVIEVRGGTTFEEEVLVTPRGPIVSPALDGEAHSLSMRAIWLEPRAIEGILRVHKAATFEEFRRTFARWPLLSLNMVYADTSGSIGWQLAGEAPRRRRGWGTIPDRGWDLEAGWLDEPVPFDDMPYVADPEAGFVATANNQPTPDGDGPFLGVDWI